MAETPPVPSRPAGRPRRPVPMGKYSVILPPDLHEWAMQQPEGFSSLMRRLLQAERRRVERRSPDAPTP